jgi:sec-independent protein translocase protein TatA
MTDLAILPDLTLALGMPGGWEWFVILGIMLLLFGRRLPEIAKGVGRSIVEFKKGIKGVEDEIEEESSKPKPPQRTQRLPDQGEETIVRQREQQPVGSKAGSTPDDESQ